MLLFSINILHRFGVHHIVGFLMNVFTSFKIRKMSLFYVCQAVCFSSFMVFCKHLLVYLYLFIFFYLEHYCNIFFTFETINKFKKEWMA